MTTIEIRTDGKKAEITAYERKMARQRPVFLNKLTLDAIVRDSFEHLIALGKKSSGQ